jgi:hypothetical protein
MSDVTFFLTSCKRHDLLKDCLTSFEKFNTYPINRGIIIEDSDEDISYARDILKSIPNLELINTGGRKGQIRNIDRCYATITTPYVFHCEDDFLFHKAGFIEPSVKVLAADPTCINVWLTPFLHHWYQDPYVLPKDHRQLNIDGVTCWPVNNPVVGEWGLGFTFQPAVHRVADWRKHNGYESLINAHAPWANIFDGGQTERNIARYYNEQGYRTYMFAGPNDCEDGYVTNTGQTRHVPLPKQEEL